MRGIQEYEAGGSEHCTAEALDQAFDPTGEIRDAETICFLAQEWAGKKLVELQGCKHNACCCADRQLQVSEVTEVGGVDDSHTKAEKVEKAAWTGNDDSHDEISVSNSYPNTK